MILNVLLSLLSLKTFRKSVEGCKSVISFFVSSIYRFLAATDLLELISPYFWLGLDLLKQRA